MDPAGDRLKWRAALAAVASLFVFVTSLGVLHLQRWLRQDALAPRIDVAAMARRLGSATGAAQQQTLNAMMPTRKDLLAAVVVSPSRTNWSSTVWRLGGEDRCVMLTVHPPIFIESAGGVVHSFGSVKTPIAATYPQRESLRGKSLLDLDLPAARPQGSDARSPDPTSHPSRKVHIFPRYLQQGFRRDPIFLVHDEITPERLDKLSPRTRGALRTALAEPDWPDLETRWLSFPLQNAQGSASGHLLVLPRPKVAQFTFATYYLRPIAYAGAAVSFLLYLFMLPWWVYLDARPRTEKALPLSIFVAITNFLGWLTYLVIRPEEQRQCPACATLLEPGFRLCPFCGWGAASRCRDCGRPGRVEWHFCPYCETPRASALETIDPAGL